MLSRKVRVRRWTLGSRITTGLLGEELELHELRCFFIFSRLVLFFYGFCILFFLFFFCLFSFLIVLPSASHLKERVFSDIRLVYIEKLQDPKRTKPKLKYLER